MLYETGHPLIQHKVGRLRSVDTPPLEFRRLVRELSTLLCYEATRDLKLKEIDITTPMGGTKGSELHQQIGLVPILRAGLGMVDGLLDLLPLSQVWHIGLYRNEETLEPVTYYNKLPEKRTVDICLVLDPMLATGGSAVATVDILKKWGVPTIKFVGLIAAPEGIRALENAHPDVDIHVAAVDSHLNEIGYIVPGLGDAGDRQFGTA
ncbi:MAG: uracil phosphoribosyltransferase [Anaerolineales bacterium]|nr:uracil phosphoribosyltransferase [Anaerolineales bacterium]MCB0008339.1 uracil phosphoribosyltransferase [Anaerolineales bacterium]MCB0013328.1 uracil phosphoribosyltransferase [Anaerolineales bacterium]MCB0020430.1 uracil phosphoribosyltransferase [Anaerolineales bacterium]